MTELDWNAAEKHLDSTIERYKELLFKSGVNPHFGLAFLAATKKRYDDGERTQDLYDEMMEAQ